VDYTPYDGLALRGYPTMTIARGQVICEHGEFVGDKRRGRFLVRVRTEAR
jgi:dihydropyrimidinase